MKYYLDTNVFVRFLVADDERMHTACSEVFGLIEDRRIKAVTSMLVFAEIVWVLGSVYEFPRAKISDALGTIGRSGILFDNRCDTATAIELYTSHPVKFVDALIASHPLIKSGKLPIVSYDRDFDKLNVKRIEPQVVVARAVRA